MERIWWLTGDVVTHQGMWWHRENMMAQRGYGDSEGIWWLIRECGGIVAQRFCGGSLGNVVWQRECGGSEGMWWLIRECGGIDNMVAQRECGGIVTQR
jgi:hypothetical protein